MKKRKRKKLKKNFFVGLTVKCLCLAGIMAFLLTPVFNVENIVIKGNTVVSTESIIKAANISLGTNTFGISLKQVKDNITAMGTIGSAKVKRILPSTISITVKESTPVVYIYDHGDCIGITADGRVTDVKRLSVDLEEKPKEEKSEEEPKDKITPEEESDAEPPQNSDEEKNSKETEDKNNENEGEADSKTADTGFKRAIVKGMGGVSYKVGAKITFEDTVKEENLYKLLEEFFSDEICADVNTVDMTQYERISFTMKSGLKVYLGEAAELPYKLKCFKAILAEELEETSKGTLDLERLTYSPKNR